MEFKIAVAGPNGGESTHKYDSYRTKESARHVLECGLRSAGADAKAHGYRVTAINGESVPAESRLSEYLDSDFDLLLDRIIPVMSFAFNLHVEGLCEWMEVFGRVPDCFEEVSARYVGRYSSREAFAAADNAEAFDLDRDSAAFKAVNWSEAWDSLGYERAYVFRKGFVFSLTPDENTVGCAIPKPAETTISIKHYHALVAEREELASVLVALEAESWLDESAGDTHALASAKERARTALKNYRSRGEADPTSAA